MTSQLVLFHFSKGAELFQRNCLYVPLNSDLAKAHLPAEHLIETIISKSLPRRTISIDCMFLIFEPTKKCSVCCASSTLFHFTFLLQVSAPEVCNWKMIDRSASLLILSHQIGAPEIWRLSHKRHSAEPLCHLHQLHMHTTVCAHACCAMHAYRLAYSSMYKQERDVYLFLSHYVNCKKALHMLMCLDGSLWQAAEAANNKINLIHSKTNKRFRGWDSLGDGKTEKWVIRTIEEGATEED